MGELPDEGLRPEGICKLWDLKAWVAGGQRMCRWAGGGSGNSPVDQVRRPSLTRRTWGSAELFKGLKQGMSPLDWEGVRMTTGKAREIWRGLD